MRTPFTFKTVGTRVVMTALALSVAVVPLATGVQAGITKPFTPGVTIKLSPGVTYQNGSVRTTGNRPQSVRVATIETTHPRVRMKSVLSNDRVVRRDLVSKMALKKNRAWRTAMVATNGDMSRRNRVDAYAAPTSMAVSSGELLVQHACTYPVLGIDADGTARIGNVRTHMEVRLPGRQSWKPIHKLNTHRDTGHVVLYTKRFASSTQTASGGREIVLDLENKVEPNGEQTVKVLQVRRGGGNTKLRKGQAVLSVKNPEHAWVYDLKVGQKMPLRTTIVRYVDHRCGGGTIEPAPAFSKIVEAQGGNHFTARNGHVAAPSSASYPQGSQRHPRTNVGITADGRVLMVTADGRRTGAAGMTLADMGRLMISLGAKHSFNLDGGGSTVIARYKPKTGAFAVANRPSDGRQRPATQALVVFRTNP